MPQNPPGVKGTTKQTLGGFNTATLYSGAVAPGLNAAPGAVAVGPDVLLFSGAGRLDTITLFLNPVSVGRSGIVVGVTFYDGHAPVSGGPVYASGHKVVAQIPEFVPQNISGGLAVASGVSTFAWPFGVPIAIGAPFQSGLCVNSRSGQIGFTAAWTPEIANQ